MLTNELARAVRPFAALQPEAIKIELEDATRPCTPDACYLPERRGEMGASAHQPGVATAGKTAARRPPLRTSPRRPPRRRPTPSRPCARLGRCASRRGRCGQSRSGETVHRPQTPWPWSFSPCGISSFSGLHGCPSATGGWTAGRLIGVLNGNIRPGGLRCRFAI